MDKNLEPYLNYVCYNCFNNVAECTCSNSSVERLDNTSLPTCLIMIDRNIQEHIRMLNNKGYVTNFCCEGHHHGDCAYISFTLNHDFGGTLPKGFVKKKNSHGGCSIYGTYKSKKKTFQEEKDELLKNLLEWCESLPYVRREQLLSEVSSVLFVSYAKTLLRAEGRFV